MIQCYMQYDGMGCDLMGDQILYRSEPNKMKIFLEELKKSGKPVVLYGAGDCGLRYRHVMATAGISVLAFVDDAAGKQGKIISGLPVWNMQRAQKEAQARDFIILISSYGPSKLYPNLERAGLEHRWRWSEFYLWEDGMDYVKYFEEHKQELETVYDSLADERSREVFRNLLQYKISRDIRLIEAINDFPIENQYFASDIIRYQDDEVFVDLGAYTGDTIQVFEQKMQEAGKSVKRVYAFEPDPVTCQRLRQNTRGYGHVECIDKGAWSEDTVLHFSSEGFWTSTFSEQGNMEVPVWALDQHINERITFLKADIEGSEHVAVLGGGDKHLAVAA